MVMCYRFVVNPGVFRPTYSSSVLLAPELLCHFCGAAWQDVEAPLIPLDEGPWASRMRGIVLVNQAAIETTACVRLVSGLLDSTRAPIILHQPAALTGTGREEGVRQTEEGEEGGGGGGLQGKHVMSRRYRSVVHREQNRGKDGPVVNV